MPQELNPEEPTRGKDTRMARPTRQYGSGALLKRRHGWAVRWREYEITPDGRKTAALHYEDLGDVVALVTELIGSPHWTISATGLIREAA